MDIYLLSEVTPFPYTQERCEYNSGASRWTVHQFSPCASSLLVVETSLFFQFEVGMILNQAENL